MGKSIIILFLHDFYRAHLPTKVPKSLLYVSRRIEKLFIRFVSMSELAVLPITPGVHLAVCCQCQVVLAGWVGCQLDNILVSQVLNEFQELKLEMKSGHNAC